MSNKLKRECKSILYLLSHPLFFGFGIISIISNTKEYFWISILLGIILGLIINLLIKKCTFLKNKYLSIINNIALLMISTYLVIKAISALYLDKTPIFIILIPLLLILYYASSKKEDTVFKISNIIFIINIILFIITFLSLIYRVNYNNFIFTNNISVKTIIVNGLLFAVLSTLPYLSLRDFKENYNYKAYLLSCLFILIIIFLIVGVLGVNVASIYAYPEYIVLKKISILGFIENIQSILFTSWIFEGFILMNTSANNIKKHTNKKILFIVLIAVLSILLFR